jgi:hypothetical protein
MYPAGGQAASGGDEGATKKTHGCSTVGIAPPGIEPKAAFWGQPKATEGEPGLS